MVMHGDFMQAALEQAWLGRGFCSPNPSVGAVIVYNETIIARAYHRGIGTEHAEQLVLKHIPKYMSNMILYVTLEPCNHWGKTPPCTDIISKYGIVQVIYGFSDPNPVVKKNNTYQVLRSKGIQVLHYPMQEINKFYESYSHWMQTKKPWITAKIAQTLDGKIALHNKRVYLSNIECNEFTHKNRLFTDIILTTANTIIRDDPLFNARLYKTSIKKPIAILDRKAIIQNTAKIFRTAKHCHIYFDKKYNIKHKIDNCTYYDITTETNGLLNLTEIIKHLGNLGYHDVWVECGSKLFSALHRCRLVQRTYIYIVPKILGKHAISSFQDYISLSNSECMVSWKIKSDNIIVCLNWKNN